ncbi:MAG: TerB N-terminal domain-containing protein [Lachnospiraceae bacterium]|nr:TerB N-terminal domain-containing protein [Lachnospiraceae bacterium]
MKKKGNFLGNLFAILILFAIVSYLLPLIKIAIAIFIIGVVLVLISCIIKHKKEKQHENNIIDINSNQYVFSPDEKQDSIKRQVDILVESIQLVNESNNLDTVLRRYLTVYNTLNKLLLYKDDELRNAGYTLKQSISETQNHMIENRVVIINQAIERNIRHDINSLKTANGKIKKLDLLYEKMKNNENLEKANIAFLEELYCNIKNNFSAQNCDTDKNLPAENSIFSSSNLLVNIAHEIADMVWIGDGIRKNYTPTNNRTIEDKIMFSSVSEEPSVLYLALPVSKPPINTPVERPPYFPTYKELTPEQRWLYWEFLSNPFSSKNNVGYAFLFYYGLERHMLEGNLEKAFDITLKLRSCYNNSSFQLYTSKALTLTCIAKQRADLALKLLEADNINENSYMPMNYLLILKYTFQFPLTVADIIKNYEYFGFNNNRYIKNQLILFTSTLSKLIQRDFYADAIDLNQYFPTDINALPLQHDMMYANISLNNYETPIPIFKNFELEQKILVLLEETHEIVKSHLREIRKQGTRTTEHQQNVSSTKLSPIENEDIPKKIEFDFSEIDGWETWDNKHILDVFFNLSKQIRTGKEILPKIEACEKSLKILKPVINYFREDSAGLPPLINCRDYGVRLYIKLGSWDDAQRVIRVCMDANAYENPNDEEAALEYLMLYREVAEVAINFIQKNPGFLQKNIYMALLSQIGEEKIPILKEFMRETYIFHKKPSSGSNKLYYIERK